MVGPDSAWMNGSAPIAPTEMNTAMMQNRRVRGISSRSRASTGEPTVVLPVVGELAGAGGMQASGDFPRRGEAGRAQRAAARLR